VDRAPNAAAPGQVRLLPPVDTVAVKVLGRLLHHQDARVRSLAAEERARRAMARRGLARFDRVTAERSMRPALAKAEARLATCNLSEGAKRRIIRILRRAPIGPYFRSRPEAVRITKLVTSLLSMPGELVQNVRAAEQAGHLPPGYADALVEARSVSAPFFEKVGELGRDLRLGIPESFGRPSGRRWAARAAAIAAELQREGYRRVWPVVAELLEPLIEVTGARIQADANHLRQLVVAAKRRSPKRNAVGSPP
jgi:hypothetical protein